MGSRSVSNDPELLLSQDVCAQQNRSRLRQEIGREGARQNRLSGSGQSSDCDECWCSRIDQSPRQLEIGLRRPRDIGLAVSITVDAGQQHVGADRCAQRHQQRHRRERIEIVAGCRLQISVEEGVRGGMSVIPDEIHDWESKIIEHVNGRDRRVELDGIEQDGLALDQDDVAQMQVTVAAPHVSPPAALLQEFLDPEKRSDGGVLQVGDFIRGKTGCVLECPIVALDEGGD